jgi:hypothetical protein
LHPVSGEVVAVVSNFVSTKCRVFSDKVITDIRKKKLSKALKMNEEK